jgi:hypothetical protein
MDVHHYSTTTKEFTDAMNDFHSTFKMQLWVSEFACKVRFLHL